MINTKPQTLLAKWAISLKGEPIKVAIEESEQDNFTEEFIKCASCLGVPVLEATEMLKELE